MYRPYPPKCLGRTVILSIDLFEVAKYINWKYFFLAWKIPGDYKDIETLCECESCKQAFLLKFPVDEREKAKEALKLFCDARSLLSALVSSKSLTADAVVLLSKAVSDGDGIKVFLDDVSVYIPMLRQQKPSEVYNCCVSLADFVSSASDYIGAFAVSVKGADAIAERKMAEGDDYGALLVKSVADRLAEAASEWLHKKVRTELWGYAAEETLSVDALWKGLYQGIRPAVGYPSMPDQSLIFLMKDMLKFEDIGISVTENGAMFPNASVCGLYFAHPKSFYFIVGEIDGDQLKQYSKIRNIPESLIRKWIGGV